MKYQTAHHDYTLSTPTNTTGTLTGTLQPNFSPIASVNTASIELEEAVLGYILLDPGILEAEVVQSLLPAAFSTRPNRLIFAKMLELHKAGRKPDTLTIHAVLEQAGTLQEVGGKTKLAQLLKRQADYSEQAIQYAEILGEQYQRQCVADSLEKVAQKVRGELTLSAASELAKEQLAQLGGSCTDAKKLTLEKASEQARNILQTKYPELTENIELEKIREAVGMSSYDWDRKIINPLKRELNAERFRFDLLNLLAVEDGVERIRQQALLAIQYKVSASAIDQALRLIKQRTVTPETQCFGLDEFLDLESEGLRWLIPELLPVGETIVLAGSPKSGKTLLAVDAAFAVATGECAFLKESVTQGRVLIVSVDESAHSTRAKLLKRGFRKGDAVEVMTKFDIKQIRTLEERLEAFRPTLVVIDSLKRITHGQEVSENSAEFADNIYTLKETLTRYGASGILIHHTNKNPDALGVGKLRGSSAIAGAVWGTWQLDHIPKPDPNNKKKLVIDPKDPRRTLSVFARDTEGQHLQIELDPENNSWTNHGGVGDSEEWEQERKTLRTRIIDVLTRNGHKPGLSGREIIELIGMTPEEGRSVYSELNRMVGKRLLTCRPAPGDKRCNIYSLPNQQPDDLSSPPDFSHTHLPPPPSVLIAEYSAEIHTQQEFPLLSKLLSNYSADSQQPMEDTPPADYSNPSTVSDSEILSNLELEGGGGVCETFQEGEVVRVDFPGSKYHGKTAVIKRLKNHHGLALADLAIKGGGFKYWEAQVSWLSRPSS